MPIMQVTYPSGLGNGMFNTERKIQCKTKHRRYRRLPDP
jgi:hypothetical protein